MTSGAEAARPHASTQKSPKRVEIWGGIECTVNRVGERYFDQIALTGHADRIVDDIHRFADLGVRTLRYPVLWERVAPSSIRNADWFKSDLALCTMQKLGIKPIVGLLHHGSGPRHTSLLDPALSRKLGEFAGAVASRYPWIEMFTPINEPLTTARFATLYGHWYPHARDDRSFARAVLNQCKAIRAAMEAIRSVIPHARLVQTEDLGKTYSTPSIAYQATFDNNRRWLTFDLLSGRLDEWHPLWWYLLESGIERHELESFLTRPCVPDVVGINHYLTSDRYLDDRVELYPSERCGGNGRHSYADVEAVRTLEPGITGHEGIIREAWARYALPLALTEVHLGCTREEQLRWLNEAWTAANRLRRENVDVRAITAWSLLGCYGWCSLLTSDFDCYEAGTFDLRSPQPRPTALATMTRALATKDSWDHPVLDTDGWWRRDSRFMYLPRFNAAPSGNEESSPRSSHRVILIAGCRGTLGRAFQRSAGQRGLAVRSIGRGELDICDAESVGRTLDRIRPWAVVNAAGYVRVDEAELDADSCYRVNSEGASTLAEQCAGLGIQYVGFSSDLVFDGAKGAPYVESDLTNPLNIYGASKARLEDRASSLPGCLIIRTSAFFGPWDSHNFLTTTFHELMQGRTVQAANDTIVSPTYVPDLVNATLDLMIDGERGIWHLANDGALTWYEFAALAAERAGLSTARLVGRPMSALGLRAKRPRYSALGSERGKLLPNIEHGIDRWVTARRADQLQLEVVESSSSV
ncbi:MAG TPA: family 1 glycosylhydrolase [Gemmatimonadaceae bacterium]|nr:family 1 glycosylhydrolase [Gemmatimonadaceae bacterium]